MNKNILIVLGGAIAVAVLVALIVQLSIGGRDEPAPVEKSQVMVLVAAQDLGAGQTLKEGDVEWQSWDEDALFPGLISQKEGESPADAAQGRLSRAIEQGEPLLRNAILRGEKGNIVAATLSPGMRAMAIEVSASSMVAGFITPGDFVDVVLTYNLTVDTEDDSPEVHQMVETTLKRVATETILQNVKVLAVDQRAQQLEKEDAKIQVGRTVTLEVNAEDAERLSLASRLGTVTLALRGLGDHEIVDRDWLTLSDSRLINIDNEIFADFNRIKYETGNNRDNVRVNRGSQVVSQPSR